MTLKKGRFPSPFLTYRLKDREEKSRYIFNPPALFLTQKMGNKNLATSPFFIKRFSSLFSALRNGEYKSRGKKSFIFPLFLALKWESTIPELSSLFFSILKKWKKWNKHQSLILTSFSKKSQNISRSLLLLVIYILEEILCIFLDYEVRSLQSFCY